MKAFLRKLRWFARRDEREAALREELEFHLTEETQDRSAGGLPEEQARLAARRDLGNVGVIVEHTRGTWTWPGLERTLHDFWFSMRALRRSPGFAVVAVLTLGVAIGAATTMYAVVDGVVLQPLPYPRSDQLVQLRQIDQSGQQGPFSDPNFEDIRDAVNSFAAVAEYSYESASVVAGSVPVRLNVAVVSRQFFDVFATPPSRGRYFVDEELREGGPGVAVVSGRVWRQHFGAVDNLYAAKLRVNGKSHTIVGVMPPGFSFPANVDIWLPREHQPRNQYRTGHSWQVVARVRDNVAIDVAQAEVTTVARRLKQQYSDGTAMTDVAVIPLRDQVVGRARPVLVLLLASVILLMSVACANLSTLLLARISTRRRELAVRTALGAKGTSLLMSVLAEPLLIAILGGLLGLVVAAAGVQTVAQLNPNDVPRLTEVRMGGTVLLFAVLATIVPAFMFSVLAGWHARRLEIADALRDSARGHTGGKAVRRLRHALVVAQLALSLVLLVGAGLLGRSFAELLSQDTGFRREGLLTITVSHLTPEMRMVSGALELTDSATLPRQAHLNRQLLERLRALPGVIEAGAVNVLPMSGREGASGTFLIVQGDDRNSQQVNTLPDLNALLSDQTRTGNAVFRVASAGYFRAMGIPLVRGRLFEGRDGPDAPHVALISETLARTRFPKVDPIGVRIQFGNMDGDMHVFTVVGIVGDIREGGLHSEPTPAFYADYRQRPLSTFDFTFVLQTSVPPSSLVADIRRVVQELSPETAPRFRTIDEIVGASVAGRRLALGLTAGFAGAAMLVAILGVYGVLSFLVTQRSQEFGVRIALGAGWIDIQRLVLGEAGRLIVLGLAIGSALALSGQRVLEGLLFGIRATDPVTYLGMGALLAFVAFLACQIPAIRAARVDPVRTLRAQ